MSRMFEDQNNSHITQEEWDVLKVLITSPRGALLAKALLQSMAEADDEAPAYFLTLIPSIVKTQMDKATRRVHEMKGWVQHHGRVLTLDKIPSGKYKGTPRFLTNKFKGFLEISAWDMLVYVYHFTNFMELYRQYELGVYRSPVMASQLCPQDDLAKTLLLRFCKFLDDSKTTPIEKLVSHMIFEEYPGMKEFISWCINNRSKWDDLSPTPKKKGTKKSTASKG